MKIPLVKPNIPSPENWLHNLQVSYEESHFANFGPCATAFEQDLKSLIGTDALTVCNATAGLQAAIYATTEQGSEILVPSFTFPATAHAILAAGCTPKFVDIGDDLCIDLVDAKSKLSHKTKAMIVVHALGIIPDISRYESFAKENGIKLIVDAATTLGLRYPDGRMIGTAGDVEVFSLHATKVLGIGEGGVIASTNSKIMEDCRKIINFGMENGKCVLPGLNGKLNEFNAAIGRSILPELDQRMSLRQQLFQIYESTFHGIGIRFVPTQANQVVVVHAKNENTRDRLLKHLNEAGIGCKIYYQPLHKQLYFRQYADSDLPRTDQISQTIFSLPMYESLTVEEIRYIAEKVGEIK